MNNASDINQNPYESPSDHDELFIVYWLKKRWWFIKGVALLIGRLSMAAGLCFILDSIGLVATNEPQRNVLRQTMSGLCVFGGGLLLSYLIYFPARRRLLELEKQLPSAVQVEDETEHSDEDEDAEVVYLDE